MERSVADLKRVAAEQNPRIEKIWPDEQAGDPAASPAELLSDRRTVAEGAFTAPVLARLAVERQIDMPIVAAVDALLAGRCTVDEAVADLLSRPPRPETH